MTNEEFAELMQELQVIDPDCGSPSMGDWEDEGKSFLIDGAISVKQIYFLAEFFKTREEI